MAYVDRLCDEVGGEYSAALKEFVTTDNGAVRICLDHSLSKSQLYRLVSAYYNRFDINA